MANLRDNVKKMVAAGVPESEIAAYVQAYSDKGTPAQPAEPSFIDALRAADWRTAAVGGGAAIGGVLGAGAGTVAMPVVGTIGGGTAGAALGAGIGGQLYDRMRDVFQGNVGLPTSAQDEMQRLGQAAKSAVYDIASAGAGEAVAPYVARMVGGVVNPVSQRLAKAWRDIGQTPPSLAAISESPAVQRVESAIAGTLTGGGRMAKAYEGGRKSLQTALDDAAERIAGDAPIPQTVEEIGDFALTSAKQRLSAFRDWAKKTEAYLLENIGGNKATLNNTINMIEENASRLSPSAAAEYRAAMQKNIKAALADSTEGTLNINTIRQARTKLGDMMSDPTTITTASVSNRDLGQLRSSLALDIEQAIPDAGLRSQYQAYMGDYSRQKSIMDLAEEIIGNKTPRQIGEKVLSTSTDSSTFGILRDALGEKGFNQLRAGAIKQLGRAQGGAGLGEGEAAASQIAKVAGRSKTSYTPEAQAILMGDEVAPIARAAQGMSEASKYYNRSETSNQEALLRYLRSMPAIVQGGLGVGGIATGAPMIAATAAAVPYGMARLHTSPAVLRVLSSPAYQQAIKSFQQAAPSLGLMGGAILRGED